VLLTAVAWFGQRRIIYRPDTERVAPSSQGLTGVTEVTLPTPDGETLVAWYTPAPENGQIQGPGGPLTVLYFHGNGAGLADRAIRIRLLREAGHGVLMLAYRGYAGSTGQPSEAANVSDARMAYEWVRAKGVGADRIVVFGESLGTGVAVQVAASKPVAAVILDSPFTSLVDVAATHFPFLPVSLLLRDRYVSTEYVGQINAPLLIVHGEKDRVVPFVLGQKLFAAAREPKTFKTFPNVGHLVPFDDRGWPVHKAFLEGIRTGIR
jgi:uncharacterized protein